MTLLADGGSWVVNDFPSFSVLPVDSEQNLSGKVLAYCDNCRGLFSGTEERFVNWMEIHVCQRRVASV